MSIRFSDQLLDDGADIWAAQKAHPFVTELVGVVYPVVFRGVGGLATG